MTTYTSAAQIMANLGVSYTPAEIAYIDTLLAPAATARIDSYTNRTWQVTPIVGERVRVYGSQAWLASVPVLSIEAVHSQGPWSGAAYTLRPASEYALRDAAAGLVVFWGYYGYDPEYSWWVTADYTPAAVIPPAVELVAQSAVLRLLVAAGGGEAEAAGPIVREQVGDVFTEYARPAAGAVAVGPADLTAAECALLGPYCRPVVVT